MVFTAGVTEIISTDDDDDDGEDDEDGEEGLALNTALLNVLFDFDVKVDAVAVAVAVDAAGVNGVEKRISLTFDAVAGAGVILNVTAGASTGLDLAMGSSIFLLLVVGAFGGGNDVVGILISVLFNFSCAFGKSTGSGGISCSFNLPAFRCFEMVLFRILLTCLLLAVVDDL